MTVYGDGQQTRSFQYIHDLIDGLIVLMNSDETRPVNLGNSDEFTIGEFAELVRARKREWRVRKISSIRSGPIRPKMSSGLIWLCSRSAAAMSGLFAQSGRSRRDARPSSSESEYSLLMSGSSMLSLVTFGGSGAAAAGVLGRLGPAAGWSLSLPLAAAVDLRLLEEGTCRTVLGAGAAALDAPGVTGTDAPEGPAVGCLSADLSAGLGAGAAVVDGGLIWRGGGASFLSFEGGFCEVVKPSFRFVVSTFSCVIQS